MNSTTTASNSRFLNSLIKPINMMNSAVNSAVNSAGNSFNSATNAFRNLNITGKVSNVATGTGSFLDSLFDLTGLFVLLILVIAGYVLYSFYESQIVQAWKDTKEVLSGFFKDAGKGTGAEMPPEPILTLEGDEKGEQKDKVSEPSTSLTPSSLKNMEKILPGGNQVFNVSSNRYTYYDAAPLCKALGAELATYEQVKEAWAKGADWCNYGWVEGQMAVYPTSDETYTKLQKGPEEQRMACGRPGLNGGYFDNPEMRFGVNCYGTKPPKSQHDAAELSKGAPISPDALAFDKKVNQYKSEADSIGINPFNSHNW